MNSLIGYLQNLIIQWFTKVNCGTVVKRNAECETRATERQRPESASLYMLAMLMQTDKTKLAREKKIGFAKRGPPTYARKLSLIKLSNYKPFYPLSFSSWLATPTKLEEGLDHIK